MTFLNFDQAGCVLSIVGGVYIFFYFYRILKYLYYLLVTFGFKNYVEFKKYGSWAGKEYFIIKYESLSWLSFLYSRSSFCFI